MCGRFVSPDQAAIERHWNLTRGSGHEVFAARYNVTLQQGNPRVHVPVIRHGADGAPELVTM